MAAVEWNLIGQVIWVSLLAGVGVTTLFALVVFGSSRAAEARRARQNPTLYAAIALVCSLGFAAVVVLAITIILNKS
jgi:hypothetical protein